jgi:methionyl-tRNA formyltransferase
MHRGPNPFSAAILAGETETGVTFHVIDEGVDTGDILRQIPFPLEPADTQFGVYGRACEIAQKSIVSLLDEIEGNGLRGTPQDPGEGTYDRKLTHDGVRIGWDMPAVHIDRLVRASTPTLYPWFMCHGRKVRVGRVKYDPAPVDAAPGTFLARKPLPTIATASGSVMLDMAFVLAPVPVLWPEPWRHILPGMKVE